MSMETSRMGVANVLINLYDKCLRDIIGKQILGALMILIDDIGLTEVLCILDVERIRLRVMICNSDRTTMSYESFYDWLRQVSDLIFIKFDESGARALNLLLTKHIIPFAISGQRFKVVSSRQHVVLDDGAFRVFMPYADFLHLWHTPKIITENIRLSPLHCFPLRSVYQPRTDPSTRTVSIERIFQQLKLSGIFPSDVALDADIFFSEMVDMAASPYDAVGSGDALNCLAFPKFLSVLEKLAKRMNKTCAVLLGMDLTLSGRLIVMIQKLTKMLLISSLQRFVDYEQRVNVQMNTLETSSKYSNSLQDGPAHDCSHTRKLQNPCGLASTTTSLDIQSVLWLARQAGITQLPGLSLDCLVEELLSSADAAQGQGQGKKGYTLGGFRSSSAHSSTSLKELKWSLSRLPRVLCEIAESYSCRADAELFAGGLVEVSSTGRLSLLLAQRLPAVFFASPERSPALVASLYEPRKLQQLHIIADDMDTFFKTLFPPPLEHKDPFCTLAATTAAALRGNANCNRVELASPRDFDRMCSSAGVTPHLLSVTVVRETCEHLLGFILSEDSLDVKVCKNDWIEITYVLAQVCFNDVESAQDDSMQKLFDLVKCFSSRSYLSHAIGRSRRGSDPHLFLRQALQSPAQSFPYSAPISSTMKSHFTGVNNQIDILRHKGEQNSLACRIEERLRSRCPSSSSSSSSSSGSSTSHRNRMTSSNRSAFSCELSNSGQRNISSGFSLRQIVIALVHYPCNSMDLNPWNIHKMFVTAKGGSSDAIADDTRQCIGRFIKAFCAQFKISTAVITEYLFSYYKEECYVADAAQMLEVRDSERQHNISAGQFLFDGHSKYTRRINVMKPAALGVMAAEIFDLLFTDRIAELLDSHSYLLSWECSRAFSRDRTQDPFTRHLKSPLPTARTFDSYPHDCRMSVSSALRWAEDMAGMTKREATLQLKRTALLSGGGCVSIDYHLTYSVFMIFAIHCFSSQALLALPSKSNGHYQSIDILEACVFELLERSSAMLSSTKRALKIDVNILDYMFPGCPPNANARAPSYPRMSAAERLIAVRHSVSAFNALLPERSCQSSPSSPPSYMWDAARFLQYCRHYGLVERTGTLAAPLRAFQKHLKAEGPLSSASQADFSIAPTSVRCTSSVVLSLLNDMARDAYGGAHHQCDLVLELLPIMISFLNLKTYRQQSASPPNDISCGDGSNERGQKDLQPHVAWSRFEDIVRYGGARSMAAFFMYRDQLHHLYSLMVGASHHVLLNEPIPARGIFKLSMCGDVLLGADGIEGAHGSSGEALLSVVCSYLSCCGLLPTGKIAAIAKGSLHPRLRPLLTSAGRRQQQSCRGTDALYAAAEGDCSSSLTNKELSHHDTCTSQDLVTASLAEYEVMLMQCAFACWEASGAYTVAVSDDKCSEGCTHSEPDPATLLAACGRGTVDWDFEDHSAVRDAAYLYCIEGIQTPLLDTDADTSRREPSKELWGVDFLGPFVRTLFTLSEVPRQHSLAVDDLKELERASAAAARERDAAVVNRKVMEGSLFLAERDRSIADEPRLARKGEVDRNYMDSCMSGRSPACASRSAVKREKVSDMQQLLNRTERLGSAAVGIHLLIGGTKVELWPLFASYCDGPDSSTPGMLTGPRLFALLSRCNLLVMGISLSDIGMLLHQVSAHLHSKAPIPHSSLLPAEASISTVLCFELFLVFLCAYSELFYNDTYCSSEIECGDTDSIDSSMTSISSAMTRDTAVRSQQRETNSSSVSMTPTKESGETSSDGGRSWPLFRARDVSISSGNIKRRDGRYSSRRSRMAEPPGLNVIVCSVAGGIGSQQSPSMRWFMHRKERLESSKKFRMLLVNELLPAFLENSTPVLPDSINRRYGSRDSDKELDRYCVLFSLDVVLALQGVEFFLKSIIQTDPNSDVGIPFLPTKSRIGKGSHNISNFQPSTCSSSSPSSPSPFAPSSPSSSSPSMESLLDALMLIGVVPRLITEARYLELLEEITPHGNNGQSSPPTDFTSQRNQSKNGEVKDSGFTREYKAATAEAQARAWVDLHFDTSADLAHMQWIVGAVALEIVFNEFNASPPTCSQSRTHPDTEIISTLVVERLRWMASSFVEKPPSTSSRFSRPDRS